MPAASKSVKMPLKTRLKVWWEGYDPEEVEARLRALEDRQKGDAPSGDPDEAVTREADSPDADLPIAPWDSRRIEITQFIWGEGYCGPGGPEQIIAMSKLLAMSPQMSALVIGAGLGGPSRVLAKEFGVWITGMEASEQLAEAAMEISIREGMAKKAPIRHYNPEEPGEFERNFDRAFAKDSLHMVANKKGLIDQISENLKAEGLFLMTDFYLANRAQADNEHLLAWKSRQDPVPRLVTVEEKMEMLEAADLGIRVNEDISDQYLSLISKAWSSADKVVAGLMEQGGEGRELIKVLMKEAEYWSDLSALLESGILVANRFLTSKKKTKTLSDW
jgi:SAM-dependent methyltransferase